MKLAIDAVMVESITDSLWKMEKIVELIDVQAAKQNRPAIYEILENSN